ncbi:amidohydrolase family protein [Francisella frigiditurris]|uniref:Amidohydrolase family protein n=1 Tax=Francisella frigiditurris TaxID=1542390 RepID=A0A1J0KUR9_9GAMM|nr:amidohydrolase family protein [Francisella frigiditurris]APC97497.1 amidohydrolase family protein [Francisella frigiditurris]
MIKIIDSHIHFWDVDNGYNKWVENTNLPRKVLPSDFEIDNFVHIEAHSENINHLCEYKWLANNFNNKNIKVIAFIDFTQNIEVFEKKITDLSKYENIVGVRQIMSKNSSSKYNPFDKEIPLDLLDKLKILKAYNMIFECQMYPDQLINSMPDIIKSNVICCIEHLGLPIKTSEENFDYWRAIFLEIINNKNIFLKLSGGDLNNSDNHIYEILYEIRGNVDSSKLCYGSNYPVSNKEDYNKWLNMICSVFIDPKEQENIFFNTANSLYQFNF